MNKVTIQDIEAKIRRESYFQLEDTTITVCVLRMSNGFDEVGVSACVDHSEFDKELGEKDAKADAINNLWPKEGYLLATKLNHEDSL